MQILQRIRPNSSRIRWQLCLGVLSLATVSNPHSAFADCRASYRTAQYACTQELATTDESLTSMFSKNAKTRILDEAVMGQSLIVRDCKTAVNECIEDCRTNDSKAYRSCRKGKIAENLQEQRAVLRQLSQQATHLAEKPESYEAEPLDIFESLGLKGFGILPEFSPPLKSHGLEDDGLPGKYYGVRVKVKTN